MLGLLVVVVELETVAAIVVDDADTGFDVEGGTVDGSGVDEVSLGELTPSVC